jgi:hypothetical protein
MDDAQAVGRMVEGVEQRIVVQAGKCVDCVEAVPQEGLDSGFGSADARHAASPFRAGK